jgi:hypothetical protein
VGCNFYLRFSLIFSQQGSARLSFLPSAALLAKTCFSAASLFKIGIFETQ